MLGVLESELESAVSSMIPDHPASFLLTPESSQAAGLKPGFPSRTSLLLWVSLLHLASELQITGDDDAGIAVAAGDVVLSKLQECCSS